MLPEQQDVLWTFITLMSTLFSMFAFVNVIQHCRTHEGANMKLWGTVFAVFVVVNVTLTIQMFDMNQQAQMGFFFGKQIPAVILLLLTWGMFFKNTGIQNQSPPIIRAAFFYTTISILLAGYTNWLPQQRSDPPPKGGATISGDITMEDYTEMGRVIVFGSKPAVGGGVAIGKGQCPLCHTFDPGDNIGRCPNLFGVEERSHTRIKEERYMNEPVKVGELEPASGIVKGMPMEIPEEYRRQGSDELTGEDYLRESIMCPSCYVVKNYGKAGDRVSPMPIITKPPVSLSPVEANAVLAWLQAKDTPGEFAKVTISLPSVDDAVPEESGDDEDAPVFATGAEPIEEIINKMGCALCHTIPGVPGAVGELGPILHEKTNAPMRIKDPNYKGKARNTREYVQESILNPSAYVVFNEAEGEPFPDGLMPPDFASKLSVNALEKLVDFISNTEAE